jgi:hypothetical protein
MRGRGLGLVCWSVLCGGDNPFIGTRLASPRITLPILTTSSPHELRQRILLP